jgi:hypothetical protein
MRILVLMALMGLPVLAHGGAASAQTPIRCWEDVFGGKTCTDAAGNIAQSQIDAFGNTTLSDNHGSAAQIRNDTFGNPTMVNPNNRPNIRTDAFGNISVRHEDGTVTQCRSYSGFGTEDRTLPECR